MRRLLKTGVAKAMTVAGVDALIRASGHARRLPLVVCHHRVAPRREWSAHAIPSMFLSSDSFERQIAWMARHYRFVPIDRIEQERGAPNGKKPAVAITFDDGYADVYHHALPVLRRHGLPATLFVVTDLVGSREVALHDRLYVLLSAWWRQRQEPLPAMREALAETGIHPSILPRERADVLRVTRNLLTLVPQDELKRLAAVLEQAVWIEEAVWEHFRAVTWEMLEEMQAAGFTIGSHTRTHPILPNESAAKVEDEIAGSRHLLEQRLGVGIDHFAYPDGRFDSRIVRAVARAGYRFAFTTCRHRDPLFPDLTMPRKTLWENCCLDVTGHFSPAMAGCQAAGVFDFFNPCGQDHRF